MIPARRQIGVKLLRIKQRNNNLERKSSKTCRKGPQTREEGEWCIKAATATPTEKTQNMSSKSRYKPRFNSLTPICLLA